MALQDLDRAIEIDPDDTWAIHKRGEIYLYLHRYSEALKIFNQTLEKDPANDWHHYLRALALAQTPGVSKTPGVSEPTAGFAQAIHLAQAAQTWCARLSAQD